tara:strand:+ start:56 stop:271 length:216 start_codon:yes stop_codon:yes gene_type:complete
MRTRNTISSNEKTELFELETDKGNIYIEVEDVGECAFELWTNEEGTSSRALIKISKQDFEKMIDEYRANNN